MDRSSIILAALAPGGGYRYSPVQVQKLMFLIDREIPNLVGGPHFAFRAYHYGPFDKRVYHSLDDLAQRGYVHIDDENSRRRTYTLTPEGVDAANAAFEGLNAQAQDFITRSSAFVRAHTFSQLVAAIYKAYPEMRENSVFQH